MKDIYDRTIAQKPYKGLNCYELETGEIGMTKDQLAILCGVDKTAINAIIKNKSPKSYSPHMTPFIGYPVELTRAMFAHKGAPTVILKWEFCASVIAYYQHRNEREKIKVKQTKLLQGESNSVSADRIVEDGCEYFVLKTGDRGMSQRGLARAANVTPKAIQYLIENLSSDAFSDWAKPFNQDNIVLTRDATKQGRRMILYRSGFCRAVIDHYSRSSRTKHNRRERAKSETLKFDFITWTPID